MLPSPSPAPPSQALSFHSQGPEAHSQLGTSYDEESAIFHLELLVVVVVENRYICAVTHAHIALLRRSYTNSNLVLAYV